MADTHEQPHVTEAMLKVSEVAHMFGVQPATVREWLRDGLLDGQKIGRGHYWRIPLKSAQALANKKYGV